LVVIGLIMMEFLQVSGASHAHKHQHKKHGSRRLRQHNHKSVMGLSASASGDMLKLSRDDMLKQHPKLHTSLLQMTKADEDRDDSDDSNDTDAASTSSGMILSSSRIGANKSNGQQRDASQVDTEDEEEEDEKDEKNQTTDNDKDQEDEDSKETSKKKGKNEEGEDEGDEEDDESGAETEDEEEEQEEDKKDKKDKKMSKELQLRLARLQKNVTRLEEELDFNLHEQGQAKARLVEVKDVRGSDREIRVTVAEVVNETQSPALGSVLGKMWSEERMFARPFFKKHLARKLDELKHEEAILRMKLKEAEQNLHQAAMNNGTAEESRQEAGSVRGKHQPLFSSKTMPAVSPTVRCVIILLVQYFLIYTAEAILQSVMDFGGSQRIEKILSAVRDASKTITFAPALCALFIGTRMRAIQLSKAQTEKYHLPQPWVQTMMYACAATLPLQAIVVFVVSLRKPSSEEEPQKRSRRESEAVAPLLPASNMGRSTRIMLTVVHILGLVVIYAGAFSVCLGAIHMPAPEQIWHGQTIPISTALSSAFTLILLFFAVYLFWLLKSANDIRAPKDPSNKLDLVLLLARDAVNLAPMLAILFVIVRMRAGQVNPETASPQPWASRCFTICTVCMFVQVAAVFIPITDKQAKVENGKFVGETRSLKLVQDVIRYSSLLCLYCGALMIMISVFLIKSPKGMGPTPKISPAMHCTLLLTNVYFIVHTALFVSQTLQALMPDWSTLDWLKTVCESGRETIMFAPMLALLCIAARMRALQLTTTVHNTVPSQAGPQSWAQEAMFFATWSVVIQVVLAYFGTALGTLESGSDKGSRSPIATLLDVVRYLALVVMYVSSTTIIVAIFDMTPETLPPYSNY